MATLLRNTDASSYNKKETVLNPNESKNSHKCLLHEMYQPFDSLFGTSAPTRHPYWFAPVKHALCINNAKSLGREQW